MHFIFLHVQEAADLKAKELARLASGKAHSEATMAANQTLQTFKMKEKEREREMEAAAEDYAKMKAAQMVRGSPLPP